jgi:hypothetical protein
VPAASQKAVFIPKRCIFCEAKGNRAEIALAFKDAYRMRNQRIGIFVALPIRSLNKLSLQ